jgi:nitrogen fixation NifU-like protein
VYSPQLLDHFEHPRNVGDLGNATSQVRVENPVCGDILELATNIEGGRIQAIRFRAKGCVPAIACGSLITEMARGKTVAEAASIRRQDVVRAIGGVPEASGHAVQLAIDALMLLLRQNAEHSS